MAVLGRSTFKYMTDGVADIDGSEEGVGNSMQQVSKVKIQWTLSNETRGRKP